MVFDVAIEGLAVCDAQAPRRTGQGVTIGFYRGHLRSVVGLEARFGSRRFREEKYGQHTDEEIDAEPHVVS
jgi:hypothetical protein